MAGLTAVQLAKELLSRINNGSQNIRTSDFVDLENTISSTLHAVRLIRNLRSPINKIPDEVLCLILGNIPSTIFMTQGGRLCCKRTFQLVASTHVCSRWRKIALDRPSLWTSIYDSHGCIESQKMFLERSKNAPLSVYVRVRKSQSSFVRDLFTLHGSRIHSLVVEMDRRLKKFPDVIPYLAFPAPRLERFVIQSWGSPSRVHVVHPILFEGDAPRLKEVVFHCPNWLPSNQFDDLVHLTISDVFRRWRPSDLVLLLSRCPRLQELIIASIPPVDGTAEGFPTLRVPLDHLDKLVLHDLEPEFTSGLLSCVILPSRLAISIFSTLYFLDRVEAIVPPSLLEPLSQLDLLGDMTRMSIVWKAPYTTILVHFSGPSDACLTIKIDSERRNGRKLGRRWLSLLRSALPVWSNIDEVWIDYYAGGGAQPAVVDALGQFMQTLPSLRKLVLVDVHDAMAHWFRVLSANPPFCPGLAALHVDRSEWVPELIPGLLDVAAVRTQQGHPIDELTVTYCARDGAEMTLDMQQSLEARFASVNAVALNDEMKMEHPRFVFYSPNTHWPIFWTQGLARPPEEHDTSSEGLTDEDHETDDDEPTDGDEPADD